MKSPRSYAIIRSGTNFLDKLREASWQGEWLFIVIQVEPLKDKEEVAVFPLNICLLFSKKSSAFILMLFSLIPTK